MLARASGLSQVSDGRMHGFVVLRLGQLLSLAPSLPLGDLTLGQPADMACVAQWCQRSGPKSLPVGRLPTWVLCDSELQLASRAQSRKILGMGTLPRHCPSQAMISPEPARKAALASETRHSCLRSIPTLSLQFLPGPVNGILLLHRALRGSFLCDLPFYPGAVKGLACPRFRQPCHFPAVWPGASTLSSLNFTSAGKLSLIHCGGCRSKMGV